MLDKANGPIPIDRRMYKTNCKTNAAVDLRKIDPNPPQLTHPKDYTYCQSLGRFAKESKIELFLTPSARLQVGTCVPVFEPNAIVSSNFINFLHFTFYQDGKMEVTTDIDEMRLVPADW